ncbi:hypothetical protein QYE76_021546, partial [Lolium multiflorum]
FKAAGSLSPLKSLLTKSSDLSVEIVPNPFLEGNIEPDPEEVDLVFDLSPSFAEVVAQVRVELNWNEPNDGVELEGRHNVGFGMHTRWKTMRINSEQRWSVYKETVAGSQDKALELFATKTVDARIELDLNRPSSPVQERSPPPMSQEEATQSPIVQSPIAQQPPLDNEYDEHDDGDDGFEMNDNNVGDLDKYWTQEEMDHSIPYSRCYASDSDDDGPEEELDEDGLTAKEAERAEIFKKVTGRDIRIPLFRDVSLADGAVVDGGKSLLLGARPLSKRDADGRTAMISKGLTFDTFLELKIWLKEFSIKHHRPYIVVHSDLKKRYTLKCVDKRCPWVVRARPFKKGPSWHITSCVATHMCRGPKLDGKDAQPDHRQLTSEFIAYKLSAEISSLPIMSIRSVQDTVKSRFAYDVKYGKAWKAKQAAFKMLKRTPGAEELLAKIGRNHDDWSTIEPTPTPIVKKRGMIKLNDEDMREAKKSLKEKGIKPEDVKNLPPIEDICETIPPSSTIEDPLYPEGHPKRVEQDSQPIKTSAPSKKKKKKHKNVVESSEPVNDPNSISISDAETESGNEHEEDNDKNDTPDKEEIEKEPEKPAKNKKNGWSITENELNAYIEGESRRARENVEETEEHPDSSSDAASSSYQHHGHVEPPRYSSAQGPYYHSMYDPPAWGMNST